MHTSETGGWTFSRVEINRNQFTRIIRYARPTEYFVLHVCCVGYSVFNSYCTSHVYYRGTLLYIIIHINVGTRVQDGLGKRDISKQYSNHVGDRWKPKLKYVPENIIAFENNVHWKKRNFRKKISVHCLFVLTIELKCDINRTS